MCTSLLLISGVCSWGWYRSIEATPSLSELSPEQRQILVERMMTRGTGVFERAFFEPMIGYTLRRNQEIHAWNDTFTSNQLGYRSGPPHKRQGVFRVLFVGDSWTYGMGVSEVQSFPKVFERLANAAHLMDKEVESWTLALPGYNTLNELAALWFFFDVLQPDAVVICPTTNDNHSSSTILPNGSPWNNGALVDRFGDPHVVVYPSSGLITYRSEVRWRTVCAAIRDTELRLRQLGIPTMLYFAAVWSDQWAHGLVQEAGLESPYLICPEKYNRGEWRLPEPIFHGTPAAHELYGRMVYQGLAEVLQKKPLPVEDEFPRVGLHHGPPPGTDWIEEKNRFLRMGTRWLREDYVPANNRQRQAAGPMDHRTGQIGRATTILVKKRNGARRLRLVVRRARPAPTLYPLTLELAVPSPSGGTTVTTEVFRHQRLRQEIVLPIPEDTNPGEGLDVILVAERVVKSPGVLAARSLFVELIEQLD